jgi:hypothetical protein
VVHFVFGLRAQIEPFHLLHYVAIASCLAIVQPDEIKLHVHHLPYGLYWDMARPLVTLERIDPVDAVERRPLEPHAAPYRYAHHADVIRLDLLARYGGMYADIDTVFVRPVPDGFWLENSVIGREADVRYADSANPERSMSNALLMARTDSHYVGLWRERILSAMDGSWSNHSCRLATRLAAEYPDLVRVEPQSSFSPFAHTQTGMQALLNGPFDEERLAGTYSVHLCAHLWWDVDRRDFSLMSARHITEDYVRRADTPLTRLARPFLPSHRLF